jgi:MFS family permease
MMTLGATIGALFGGPVLAVGRWNSIFLSNILIVTGSGLTLVDNFIVLLIGRFIYGLGAGSFNVFCPKMVGETTPNEIIGRAGIMF